MNLRGGVLFISVLLGVLAAAPMADAATRYVSPAGDTSANSCTVKADPCDLKYALESVAQEDDVVILDTGSGPYTLTSLITVAKHGIAFGSATPGGPAVINSAGYGIVIDANAVGVFDVTINGNTNVQPPLQFTRFATGSGGSGITVKNSSTQPTGALRVESDVQLSNSLFVSATTTGSTVLAGDGSFLNITAIASDAGTAFTGTQNVAGSARTFLLNSILRSETGEDIVADGSHAYDYVYGSNFDSFDEPNGGHVPPDYTNQTDAPQLTGTFRQLFTRRQSMPATSSTTIPLRTLSISTAGPAA